MSVQVKGLTKVYDAQKAIDQVSFKAQKGEVLGFLGPNGAGKTTTMKILTCFIPQSSGTASVCGFDTAESPMEVRERIGYLPEHNPLYLDMFVWEYLQFIAKMHKLKNPKNRIGEMIEMTGLQREQHKPIGALSKGYRQRVGLAQAMIHDPEVLILDEPTSGLDPNQLVDIRNLIKTIGQEKTVIFSTHIMQEVQAICDRVLIINKGKLVANDPIERLQQRISGGTTLTVEFAEKLTAGKLKGIKGIKEVKELSKRRWQLVCQNNQDPRAAVFHFAVDQKLTLLEMQREQFSVEDVFQELTKN
ncbi:MAG: gliding motility-associated ABC transporter ATP-binding subunit GldA [Bacteroidota bacterium]